jgi:uncharacterized protein YprB with RNaseH-like and TPR domain
MAAPLQARLAALNRPWICAAGGEPRASDSSLAGLVARLERLRAGSRQRPNRAGHTAEILARHLGGRVAGDGLIEVERRLPLWHRQGRTALVRLARLDPAELACLGLACRPQDLLFLDTETTGLAGGTGTLAFLAGLGALEDGQLVLRQFLMTRPGAEAEMLALLASACAPGRVLVTYNGKCFDLPLLATRFRLGRLPDPCAGRAHADLLQLARRALRGQVPDFRLRTLEERALGHWRENDLPGSEAPAAWRALLREGRWDRIRDVLRHNRDDLVSLAALTVHLASADRVLGGGCSRVLL